MKTIEGEWYVRCNFEGLSVRKNVDGGLWYHTDDPDFNEKWYGTGEGRCTKEQFESIKWPIHLKPGETELIIVTKSGNYYVEDS